MISPRFAWGRAGVTAAVTLAALVTLGLPFPGFAAPTTSVKLVRPATATATSTERWLTGKASLTKIATISLRDARHFFSSSRSFVIGKAVPGYAATPVTGFRSFAKFEMAVGSLHRGQWVLYDNEHWSLTPVKEQRHPAVYMRKFADLAHQHGLKVIETPARDLMAVPGGACVRRSGQTNDQAYLACDIPRAARYADIYEIQAQADQSSTSGYARFVRAARHQALAANRHLVVLAGLTTDRGGSAAQLLACWKATKKLVAGYWMNTSPATVSTAAKALTLIRQAGG